MANKPADDTHAFVDNTGRHPKGALLRKHGWRIARRKKGLPILWEKGGETLEQAEIERMLPKGSEY